MTENKEYKIDRAHKVKICGIAGLENRIISAGKDGQLKLWTFDVQYNTFSQEAIFKLSDDRLTTMKLG